VFAILGEASASSSSKNTQTYNVWGTLGTNLNVELDMYPRINDPNSRWPY